MLKHILTKARFAVEQAEATLERKESKEVLTDRDEEIIAGLEDFIAAVEGAMDELADVYGE